jgi:hypothetical protein
MRILVDEMPKEPCECPYSAIAVKNNECVCMWNNNKGRIECKLNKYDYNGCCPYFTDHKTQFENEISNYDVQKFDPYRYG